MCQLSAKSLGRFHHLPLTVICLLAMTHCVLAEFKGVDERVIDKWKAYEIFSRGLQGMARQITTSDSGNTQRLLISYKQNRECVMICFSKEQDRSELCRFGNSFYAASIKRSKSDPNQVVLERFTQSPHEAFPGFVGDRASVFDALSLSISPHFRIVGMPLSQFSADSSFTILKESKEFENGRELIRLDFNYTRADLTAGTQAKGRGSTYLDPSRCWCVRRIKYSLATTRQGLPLMDAEHEIEFEIIDHSSGFPLVKSKISRDNLYPYKTKKRLVSTTHTDYEWTVNNIVSDSEFTLSAFGLPEPMGVPDPEKPSRTWLWLLTATVGSVAVAILFAWLKRRRALNSALGSSGRS